jgi:outer membrane protein OmpA-like peptidoglycan-associated protein
MALGALFTLLVAGLVFVVLQVAEGDENLASLTETSASGSSNGSDTGDAAQADTGGGEDGADAPEAADVTATTLPDGPYVLATLQEADFVLSGVVPSADLATGLTQAADVTYAPLARSDLAVDEQLEPVDWLGTSPAAISLLAITTQGSMLIANGEITVSGQLPTQVAADRLEVALAEASGLPVTLRDIEITNLQPPYLTLANLEGQVAVGGRVPTQEIRDGIAADVIAVYGAENVTDELQVDENVHPALWMYSTEELMQATTVFPEIDIQIDGSSMTGLVRGGYTFEPGSPDVTPTYAEVLEFGVGVMIRDQSLHLLIEGHTDADGDDAFNLDLSQQRAESVAAFFTNAGIDPDRITAVGKGETEPIAANDTEDGRARNRRIEVVLSAVPA